MSCAAPQGPYGPDNPPPPPPGSPPGQNGRKRGRSLHEGGVSPWSLPEVVLHYEEVNRGSTRKKRKSNHQRKKFLERKAKRNERQGQGYSGSPAAGGYQNSQAENCERSNMWNGHDRDLSDSKSTPQRGRRNTLQDARQYTPDQIIDETHGRLSPPKAIDSRGQGLGNQANLQWSERQRWPNEERSFTHHSPDAGTYGDNSMVPKFNTSMSFGKEEKHPHDLVRAPTMRQQAYDVEDEVDWDDDEAFNIPIPGRKGGISETSVYKPQSVAYGGGARDSSVHEPKGPTSSSWRQQSWLRPVWNDRDERPQTQQVWAERTVKPLTRTSYGERDQTRHDPRDSPRRFDTWGRGVQNGLPGNSKVPIGPSHPTAVHTINAPDTAFDLRQYDTYITELHKNLPKHKAYRNGNGKVAPHIYGSMQDRDLGLCFVTFCTDGWCEMGVKCAWRHHPLTKAEREWITHIGKRRSKDFLEQLPRHWPSPEVPLPGASMYDKVRM